MSERKRVIQAIEATLKRMGMKVFSINIADIIAGGAPKVTIEAYISNEDAENIDDLDYRIKRLEESRDGAHAQADRWGRQRDLLESRVIALELELAEVKESESKATLRRLDIEGKLFRILEEKPEE